MVVTGSLTYGYLAWSGTDAAACITHNWVGGAGQWRAHCPSDQGRCRPQGACRPSWPLWGPAWPAPLSGIYGASRIIAIDLDDNRVEQAKGFGVPGSCATVRSDVMGSWPPCSRRGNRP
jgi:hypothetical protein